jgi:hypothetical protein
MDLRRLFQACVVALVAGCATTANYEKILDGWVGSPADDLVSAWGPPQGSYDLSDGGKVIEYVRSRNVQVGGYPNTVPQPTYRSHRVLDYGGMYSGTSTTYVQPQAPVRNITKSCRTDFTINRAGIITKWHWEGNDCKARAPE